MPMLGYFMCEIQFLLLLGYDNLTFVEDRNKYVRLFAIYGVFIGFVGFLQKFMFAISGENVTTTIRHELFESLLHKQVSWFDRKSRAPGIISNMLSEDVTNVLALTGT